MYSEMMSLPGSSEDEGIIVLHADRDPERLKEILRYIILVITGLKSHQRYTVPEI